MNESNMGMGNHHAPHYELIELCADILVSQKEIVYRMPEEVKKKTDQTYVHFVK